LVVAPDGEFSASTEFRLESHLRDYLAQNLGLVKGLGTVLRLFEKDGQALGIEFQTDVGRIDILAVGDNGAFYVLELKLSKGPDAAVGQTLRYMAAIRASIANGKPVFGVIVASTITDRLRFAVSEVREKVFMLRYELQVSLESVEAVL
jgi:RecB family endonuclease NucS